MEIFFLLWCRFAVNGDCFYCGAYAVVKSLQRKPRQLKEELKEEFEDEEDWKDINLKKRRGIPPYKLLASLDTAINMVFF